MSTVFKILHIPTGEFITAFRDEWDWTPESRPGIDLIFYDSATAVKFLDSLINKTVPYIYGGPSNDYYLGSVPIPKYRPFPILHEFELLPFEFSSLYFNERQRIIKADTQHQDGYCYA